MITINQELAEFKKLPELFRNAGYFVTKKDEYAFVVSSDEYPKPKKVTYTEPVQHKKYDLFLSALVHGNETGGLRVLNWFGRKIIADKIKIPHSFFFCLGNVEAAQKGVRFVERDLNRSFLSVSSELYEEKLAKRIEGYVKDCAFCIDLHQTNEASVTPFMIFIYTAQKLAFARHMDSEIPIITSTSGRHKDGSTLDFYCYKNNIISTTLELGKAGFDDIQAEYGVRYLLKYLEKSDLTKEVPFKNIFRIAESIYWFDERIILNPGLINFTAINKGDVVGKKAEIDYPSPHDGVILFPKYGKIAENTKEVFTVAKPISDPEELKKEPQP